MALGCNERSKPLGGARLGCGVTVMCSVRVHVPCLLRWDARALVPGRRVSRDPRREDHSFIHVMGAGPNGPAVYDVCAC